jgi:ribosomal 50S subunit-associated protein YjgA (DUF615 family)
MTDKEEDDIVKRLLSQQSPCQDIQYTVRIALQEEAANAIRKLTAKVNFWKTQAEMQHVGLLMANEDCETKDAEIERLRAAVDRCYSALHAHNRPDKP